MFDQFFLKYFVSPLFLGSLFLGMGIVSMIPLSAASYDYYVKEGESGDGSKEDPFGSIKDAVEAVDDAKGKKIFVEKGSYSASFTVPKGTTIVGVDAKEVTITGHITLDDDVELEKLGFGGSGSILVSKNSSVTLENLRFKSLSGIGTGIKTEPGSTKVAIRDSAFDTAKKGMYIQAGSTLVAEKVEIINSHEEGIDIRENVSGSITNSVFRDNKESGVEIILGSANFSIRNSTFSNNGASGIATQYFQGAKKAGNVKIENNTFSKNDNYGIDCKAPQSGPDSKFYYLNSLTIANNTFKENNEGDIAKRCRIMTDEERMAYEKAEAEKKALAETKASLTLSESALSERLVKAVEFRKTQTEKRVATERNRLEPTLQSIDALVKEGEMQVESVAADRSKWTCYITGERSTEALLVQSSKELNQLILRLTEEGSSLQYEENRVVVSEKMTALKALQEKMEAALQLPTCSFSLFGWVTRFFINENKSIFTATQLDTLTFIDTNPEAKVLFLGTLSYYPKVREVAVLSGDERLVSGLLPGAENYAAIMGDLRLPLGTEADPLLSTTAEASFPVRFANIFSGANIRSFHLSNAAHIAANMATWEKTAANLAYAEAKTLGKIAGGEPVMTTWLGEKKLHWVDFSETGGINLTTLREVITPFQENNEPVVVVVAWDEKQSKTLTPKREELLREVVKAGASLVIGTGLIVPFEQKTIDTVPVYFSLGSAFEKFQTGDASKKSVALEMKISPEGKLEVIEKNLTFTAEKGLEILP